MKKIMIVLNIMALILGFCGSAMAAPVTFNFNSLADGANAAAISSYMSGLFGGAGSVTVTGASPQAESAFFGLLGPDTYIESEPSGAHTIQINFATPITSVSFDWAKLLDPFNADYSVDGTTNFTNFFNSPLGIIQIDHFNTITFASPVLALRFHDDGVGEIGIDNLVVDKVPEPMSILLLGLGLLGIGAVRRKK